MPSVAMCVFLFIIGIMQSVNIIVGLVELSEGQVIKRPESFAKRLAVTIYIFTFGLLGLAFIWFGEHILDMICGGLRFIWGKPK